MHTYGAVCCVHCSVDDGTTVAPDEKTCGSDEFTCGDGTCIPLSQRCDWTEYHCPDGTDEFDCRMLLSLNCRTLYYAFELTANFTTLHYLLIIFILLCL